MSQSSAGSFTWVAAAAILGSVGLMLWLRPAGTPEEVGGLEPGKPMPVIRAEGWLNGEPHGEQFAGKVVVVHGWFTTCPYCHKEAPELVELYDEFHAQGVEFVSLTFETSEALAEIKQFVSEKGMTWPNGYGARDTLIEFEAEYYPCVWVVGRDGRILWNRDTGGDLKSAIEAALATG